MPIAIIATLVICTLLYVGVAVVLTGIVPWASMTGDAALVVNVLKKLSLTPDGHRLHWIRLVILLGALIGMVSAILVFQLASLAYGLQCPATGCCRTASAKCIRSFVHPLWLLGWQACWWRSHPGFLT